MAMQLILFFGVVEGVTTALYRSCRFDSGSEGCAAHGSLVVAGKAWHSIDSLVVVHRLFQTS